MNEQPDTDRFDFLRKPVPKRLDGIECIVIHEKAQTELGRLLTLTAKTPVMIVGVNNPNSDIGAWDSLYEAITKVGSPAMAAWANDYYHITSLTHLVASNKNTVERWLEYKLQQNWYIQDVLVNERLPHIFVYHETVMIDGEVHYVPLPSFDFISHKVRNYRNEIRGKEKRAKERDDKRERKKQRRSGQ